MQGAVTVALGRVMVDDKPGNSAELSAKVDIQGIGIEEVRFLAKEMADRRGNPMIDDTATAPMLTSCQLAAKGIDPCEAEGGSEPSIHSLGEELSATHPIEIQDAVGDLSLRLELRLPGKRARAIPTSLDGDRPVEDGGYWAARVESEVGEDGTEGGGGMCVVPTGRSEQQAMLVEGDAVAARAPEVKEHPENPQRTRSLVRTRIRSAASNTSIDSRRY